MEQSNTASIYGLYVSGESARTHLVSVTEMS